MDSQLIELIVRRALDEDLPDITSEAIFDAGDRGRARFIAKAGGVLAGLPFAQAAFKALEADGWLEVRSKGSHRQFRHPTKPGRVTVAVHAGRDQRSHLPERVAAERDDVGVVEVHACRFPRDQRRAQHGELRVASDREAARVVTPRRSHGPSYVMVSLRRPTVEVMETLL